MSHNPKSHLDRRKSYLQIAFNSTIEEAEEIIDNLPADERIILEAGTPLIKRYGVRGISRIFSAWSLKLAGSGFRPYVVADLKTMDRGSTETQLALEGGASAAIALGSAPTETLNSFIDSCESLGIDSMIDMMNVEYPLAILRELKRPPAVVILHRGVDEEKFNREKQIPYHEIQRIKGAYNIMISIAGGDTSREVQRSVFNGANIAVIWKGVFENTGDTIELVNSFLREIR